jgi:Protein of unknown function (DUF1579)
MDMPKPSDFHKKLAALVGDWSGAETLHPAPWEPAGGTATGRVVNRWTIDGFALIQEYEQRRDGQVTFKGHGVFWWDPARQQYVMHWWDSMGGTGAEYRGRFDGDVLMLSAPMPQGGRSRTSWRLTGPDSHVFLMEVSPDGENWHPAMEGRYTKGARKVARKAKKAVPKKATTKTTKATKTRRATKPAKARKAKKR